MVVMSWANLSLMYSFHFGLSFFSTQTVPLKRFHKNRRFLHVKANQRNQNIRIFTRVALSYC